jgi:hypothetical protein
MKTNATRLALVALVVLGITAAAPRQASAETVTGKKYSVFIYSKYVAEPAATITFKNGGVLLLSAYSGFGWYYPVSSGVVAVFSAPEAQENKDLFMVMVGLLRGNFLAGTGITFTNGAFSEIFFFSGYEATS